jgi:hypothetical protein
MYMMLYHRCPRARFCLIPLQTLSSTTGAAAARSRSCGFLGPALKSPIKMMDSSSRHPHPPPAAFDTLEDGLPAVPRSSSHWRARYDAADVDVDDKLGRQRRRRRQRGGTLRWTILLLIVAAAAAAAAACLLVWRRRVDDDAESTVVARAKQVARGAFMGSNVKALVQQGLALGPKRPKELEQQPEQEPQQQQQQQRKALGA